MRIVELNEAMRRLVLQLSGRFYEIRSQTIKKIEKNSMSKRSEVEKDLQELTSILLKETIFIVSNYLKRLFEEKNKELNSISEMYREAKKELEKYKINVIKTLRKRLSKDETYSILHKLEKLKAVYFQNLTINYSKSKTTLRRKIKKLEQLGYISTSKHKGRLKLVFRTAPWSLL